MRKHLLILAGVLIATLGKAQGLRLNDLDYFERQGVNILVFSNSFNGGFNDEKDSGIEIREIRAESRRPLGKLLCALGLTNLGAARIIARIAKR